MRIPRFRIRTMMLAVAVTAALSAGVATIHGRAVRFQELSVLHQLERGRVLLGDLEVYLLLTDPQVGHGPPSERAKIVDLRDRMRREAKPIIIFQCYHWDLAVKYACAAKRPWRAVPPDPAPPPAPSLAYQKAYRARYADFLLPGIPSPPPIRTDLADETVPTIAL